MAAPRFSCPYPGLRPFQQDEAELFFGREEQIDDMLARLEDNRFLAVVGASGAGKSSLVRAGLLPALEQGMFTGAETGWSFVVLRPGKAPFANLAAALLEVAKPRSGTPDVAPAYLEATLRGGPRGLDEGLRLLGLAGARHVLILVDQFEEIFRFCRTPQESAARVLEGDRNDAAAFVSLLLATARLPQAYVHVVLTMRSEFIGDCDAFHGLPEAVSASQFLVPRLTREQLREAIQGPLRIFGTTAEPALINGILNDAGTDPDQLPLMSNVLMRTWRLAVRQGAPRLQLEHYRAVGGMAEALSRHADEAFDGLKTSRQKVIAERLFRCLSDRSAGGCLTRRLTKVQEVAAVAQATPDEVIEVVRVFQQESRNFIVSSPAGGLTPATDLDISHESLLRQWGRLNGWVEKEAESATSYRQLVDGATRRKQRKAGLLRQPELGLALAWRRSESPSPAWAERYHRDAFPEATRYLKWSAVWYLLSRGVFVVAICIIGAFLFLQNQKLKTERNRASEASTNALNQAKRAEFNRNAALMEKQRAEDALGQVETNRQANQDLLVKSLLRTIGLSRGKLTRPEYEALWDLGELPQKDFRIRREFGKRALADDDALNRLESRSSETIHSLVALDRLRVTELSPLLWNQYSKGRRGFQRECLERLLGAWFAEAPEAERARILEVFRNSDDQDLRSSLANALAKSAARGSAEVCVAATTNLIAAFREETNSELRGNWLCAIAEVASSAQGEAVSLATLALVEALGNWTNLTKVDRLPDWVSTLRTAKTSPEVASASTRLLLEKFAKTEAPERAARQNLAGTLAGAASRATRDTASAAAMALIAALQKEDDASVRLNFAEALGKLMPETSGAVATSATAVLLDALAKETDGVRRPNIALSLRLGCSDLSGQAASAVTPVLVEALCKEGGAESHHYVASILEVASKRASTNVASAAADRLIRALNRETDSRKRSDLAFALGAVLENASEVIAIVATTNLVATFATETNPTVRADLASALGCAATKVPDALALQVITTLIEKFATETNPEVRRDIGSALGRAATKVPDALAFEVITYLAAAFSPNTDEVGRASYFFTLGGMGANASAKPATMATTYLLEAFHAETNSWFRRKLADYMGQAAGGKHHLGWVVATNLLGDFRLRTGAASRSSVGAAIKALPANQVDEIGIKLLDWYWGEEDSARREELADLLRIAAPKASPEVAYACLEILLGTWEGRPDLDASKWWSLEDTARESALFGIAERLPAQQIVELLKYPTSLGQVRAALLKALEKQTGRQFHGDVWQLAEQAPDSNLDIVSPPKRPLRPAWLSTKNPAQE